MVSIYSVEISSIFHLKLCEFISFQFISAQNQSDNMLWQQGEGAQVQNFIAMLVYKSKNLKAKVYKDSSPSNCSEFLFSRWICTSLTFKFFFFLFYLLNQGFCAFILYVTLG